MRSEDRVAVAIEPGAKRSKRSPLKVRDPPAAIGTDVDQEVSALAHDIDEEVDEILAAHEIGGRFRAL